MADRSTSPSYCKQARKRGTPLAYVELDGIRYYLGAYGTPESRERYHRLLAEWNAAGTQKRPEPSEITIIELCARYMRYAEQYYRSSNGKPTSELHCFVTVVRLLTGLYGRMNASEFGPLALKTIRDQMINADWVRSHINKQVSRIKMIFKWGVAEELVSPSVHHALSAVSGLKLGRSRARESEPVKPVSETHIEAIRPHVAPQVWAPHDYRPRAATPSRPYCRSLK